MNDTRFTSSIRQALDESVERLPLRVTHRLEQARKAALGQASECMVAARAPAAAAPSVAVLGLATAGGARVVGPLPGFGAANGAGDQTGERAPWFGWRLVAIVFPVAALAAGMLALSELDAQRRADEVAELEAAVLADDVPIAVYADRGFGVFLKNSRLAEE